MKKTGSWRRLLPVLVLAGILPECAERIAKPLTERELLSPERTAFYDEGTELFLGVDVRAARVAGPTEFIPVQLVVVNKSRTTLVLDREGIALEQPDGTRLPLSGAEEFYRDYRRARPDVRLAPPYLGTIAPRFPEPPFHWRPLEFFPLRGSGTFPRSEIDLRFGDAVHGYLYFRTVPGSGGDVGGIHRLLITFRGSETTHVVQLVPYAPR